MDAVGEFLNGQYAIECSSIDELKIMMEYLIAEDVVYFRNDWYKNFRSNHVLLSDEDNIRAVYKKNVEVPIISLKNFIWRIKRMDLLEGRE